MGSSTPDPVNPGKAYGEGIQAYLKNLPQLLAAEQNARTQYDPQRIQQNLDNFNTYDPNYMKIRGAMEDNVLQGVQNGYGLPPALDRQLTQSIRGGQAARGNIYGNAPISAETVFKGQNAINLYNQNMAQAGTFLGMPSPATPDRAAGYTAGGIATAGSLGAQAYQSQFQQTNPWATALGGAASGAAAGYTASGGSPYGALFGALAGGTGGYLSSDENLKENISETGEHTKDGIPIVTFNYRFRPTKRYRGVIAQAVEKVRPDAVRRFGEWLSVNYDTLGLRMTEI